MKLILPLFIVLVALGIIVGIDTLSPTPLFTRAPSVLEDGSLYTPTTSPSTMPVTTTTSDTPTTITDPITTTSTPIISSAEQNTETIAPLPAFDSPPSYLQSTEIRDQVADGVINILCETTDRRVISATGIVISITGHILSNAHVTQNLDGNTCRIRQGSPAKNWAFADLLFIPNAYKTATSSYEQARHDISLWKVSSAFPQNTLPESFTMIPIDYATTPSPDEPLAVFSYPAEIFDLQTILRSLSLLFTNTVVIGADEYFIESKDSLSSQKGSSGGALIDRRTAMLRGLIFGVSNSERAAERSLFSLRPDWISQIIENETGKTLQEYITE